MTDLDRLRHTASRLDARSSELATSGAGPTERAEADHDRTLARRCDLAAYVVESQQLVDAITADITLLAERHAQVFTGRLVGEYEREQLDSVMARAHQLRFELTTQWPRLCASVGRILDQADHALAAVAQ